MLVIRHHDVEEILEGREPENIRAVADAYRLHETGGTVVPHSVFLRLPDQPRDRIIGLPAFRGGDRPVAGMKWISSFPGNLDAGLQRASAAIILNSTATGHPEALVEGSVISARRTAASAALAAELLTRGRRSAGVSLLGCGVINFEILRHLRAALPELREVTLYDHSAERARAFAARIAEEAPGVEVGYADSPEAALAAHTLVSFATTAGEPHIGLEAVRPGTVVLHISLRDLRPEALLDVVNIVDDADHVCRERTSLHLAEQLTGGRDFITASIGELLQDEAGFVPDPGETVVFSPFGLGFLDLALADLVHATAREKGLGVQVDGFLPA
ncbi:2,3-diaminopropionate biosynthesis protein SbnB [Streptomyces sp. APSN-46.1]|uniref:2,3-diaminopropionate biosynthesis protein SbnB n=1 Tax=Streptomyces sp. APSN-46.1 TaxID=2929049 RepID=UPI001FB2DF94|nr:2,3-diaminopropionate biosynthesis protein SbnB [Streptomyces sp. APSN-46.1]MCJ1678505.1 2,3-diaminopropionate biosynthesis protein SbnB [Streptomyces sp. APSN-46.1]